MKAIQITMDEELLEALDRTLEVRREGRSAVLRRAASEYLARRRRSEIAEAYEKAYGEPADLEAELVGWSEEGRWPER